MRTRLLLLLIFTTLISVTVAAEMYRYTDESGQTVYSQFKPVMLIDYTVIAPPPPPPGSKTADAKESLSESDEQMDNEASAEDAIENSEETENIEEKTEEQLKQALAEKELKRKNCQAARSNLKVLESTNSNQRIIGEDGKEINFDDKLRSSKIKEAKRMIKVSCGK